MTTLAARLRARPLPVTALTTIVSVALLTGCVIASLGFGTVALSPAQVFGALFHASSADVPASTVVWSLRAPRTIVAGLVGAGLATVGAVLQALLRNPLADPGVTGVSTGAAVGAVAAIILGAGGMAWAVSLSAFAGAIVVALVLQLILVSRRDLGPSGIILVGVAISALGGALVSLLIANAHDDALARGAVFWLAGDLDLRTWNHVLLATPILFGIGVFLFRRRALDALSLGEDVAATSGVSVRRERVLLLTVASLVTGAAVAVSGIISFVGLLVPHALRLVIGAGHARLLPLSALVGAAFLILADTVARTAFSPVVVQTGVVCALAGAPVFLALLLRRRA